MGLFDKLLPKLTGGTKPSSSPQPAAMVQPRTTAGIHPPVQVSDTEVAERVRKYAFVLTTDPPALKAADQWWNEDIHKRWRREGSEKAYAWLLPFVPVKIAKLKQLQAAQELGPHGAGAIAKNLRILIRERRKAKTQYQELLQALYGACVAADLSASLKFGGVQPHYMARFVDIKELQSVDFRATGYQRIESLSKTDVKWLVEAFGEPAKHESFDALWPHVRRNVVARYCWSELRSYNDAAISRGLPQQTMQEWLNALVRRNIGYFKEWQERVAKNQAVSGVEPGADFRFQEDPDTLIRVKFKKPARATLSAMIFTDIPVVGASQPEARRNIALFIAGTDRSLRLERNPENPYDKNAIKVLGIWKGRDHQVTGSGSAQLGWVPREICAEIAEDKELRDVELLPTLRTMFLPSRERSPGLRFDIWLGGKLDQADTARSVGTQDTSEAGTYSSVNEPYISGTKKCPVCAEIIKFEAIKCRFCGEKFDPEDVARQIKTREEYFMQNRVPCSDESCVGIIRSTGRCGVCGKKYKG